MCVGLPTGNNITANLLTLVHQNFCIRLCACVKDKSAIYKILSTISKNTFIHKRTFYKEKYTDKSEFLCTFLLQE